MEATYEDYVDKVARSYLWGLRGQGGSLSQTDLTIPEVPAAPQSSWIMDGARHSGLCRLPCPGKKAWERTWWSQCQNRAVRRTSSLQSPCPQGQTNSNQHQSQHTDLTDKPASTSTPPSVSGRSSGPFKLKILSFSGRIRDFQGFYDRFTDLIATHASSYSDADKCCLLAEAMENLAIKTIVEKYAQGPWLRHCHKFLRESLTCTG